jgi:hypothetical protein
MVASFSTLKSNHYSSNVYSSDFKDKKEVYKEIGYGYETLVKQNGQYENTCAVRMSLALLKSNIHFDTPVSRLTIKEGTYKGRFVATGAKTLADELRKPNSLGEPKTGTNAEKAMETMNGVVLFHRIPGYGGGHIDLVEAGKICHSDCYFSAKLGELWFWPLI